MMQYKNPVLPGFYPDPSICRAGDTFYLATSSFEYFPCIPLFESKDLVHWVQIGHVLDEGNAITLLQGHPNRTGMYAPTLRYHEGVFYVVCTNVAYGGTDNGNFIVTANDPRGPWSKPIFIDLPGIDPSLFFDDDGSVYYTGTDGDIYLCRLDIQTGKALEPRYSLGFGTGGCAPEGPHLYKVDGWYYLVISEGGTELGHMVTVSRSLSPYGPYESFTGNPILTHRSLDLAFKATGHADLVCDTFGQWWAVCLGIRTLGYPFRHNLGRETLLAPVKWEAGWPMIGTVHEVVTVDRKQLMTADFDVATENVAVFYDFKKEGGYLDWNWLYNPVEGLVVQDALGLKLKGNAVPLSKSAPLAWYGRRQTHLVCSVQAHVTFSPENEGEEAGLTVYMNNAHHYEVALGYFEQQRCLILRRQIGTLSKVEKTVPYVFHSAVLRIDADRENYVFKFKQGEEWIEIGRGETQYLTTEVGGYFTGNFFALYASGNGATCSNTAVFSWLRYVGESLKIL